jgi:hypothetical protein
MAVPAALLLVAPFAGAQSQAQQDYPRTDNSSVSTVQVTAPPKGIIVTSDQAESIKGTYEMSNGWHLKAQPVAATHGMTAQIDRQPPMRLIALPGGKFVTADGNVAMEFGRGAFKDEMAMSYVPTSSVPGDSTEQTTVASR